MLVVELQKQQERRIFFSLLASLSSSSSSLCCLLLLCFCDRLSSLSKVPRRQQGKKKEKIFCQDILV